MIVVVFHLPLPRAVVINAFKRPPDYKLMIRGNLLKSLIKFFLAIPVVFCLFILKPYFATAAETETGVLTAEEKAEKRLLFNQYVEDELARAEKKKYEERQAAATKKLLISKATMAYGYDNNVNSDSNREGDGFFQEIFEGSFKIDRPDIKPFVWPGKIGVNWYTEFYNYETHEASSYNSNTLTFFTEEKPNSNFTLRLSYDLNLLRYPDSDQLTYWSHKFKPTLTQVLTPNLSQNIYTSYELKEYRDKFTLSPANLPQSDHRDDKYYELGYGLRALFWEKTYLGATTAYKRNDSTDAFNDYNDYSGYKITGYVYQEFTKKYSAVIFSGFDDKHYDSRPRSATVNLPEIDRFTYVGGYFYVNFTKNWQGFFSWMYKENNSNVPLLEYADNTTSTGLSYTF